MRRTQFGMTTIKISIRNVGSVFKSPVSASISKEAYGLHKRAEMAKTAKSLNRDHIISFGNVC